MASKNRTTLKICGLEYTVKGLESEEYMNKLGMLVDKKMSEVTENNSMLSTCMAAVLTALNIANDYTKEQEKHNELQEEFSKLKDELEKLKAENERLNKENYILVSSNTQLQLEFVKKDGIKGNKKVIR